jgi:hypothetical protein
MCEWPDFIGIVDASSHGVGGVIFGKLFGVHVHGIPVEVA